MPKTTSVRPADKLNRLASPISICRTAKAVSKATARASGATAAQRSTIAFSATPSTAWSAAATATVAAAPMTPIRAQAAAAPDAKVDPNAASPAMSSAKPRNWPRCVHTQSDPWRIRRRRRARRSDRRPADGGASRRTGGPSRRARPRRRGGPATAPYSCPPGGSRACGVGVIEELDVAGGLAHPREQHRGVAQLLLGVRVDVEDVIPKGVTLLRRGRGRARHQIELAREQVVVERREPGAHLRFVTAPVIRERRDRRVVGHGEGFLPDRLGPTLQPRPPAQLDVERVHERAAKVARRERGRHRELCPGESARAVEDPVLHPVAEVEERLEVLAAHRGEPTPSLRAR